MKWSISKGLFFGSVIGATISLLDKQTRTHSIQNIQSIKKSMTDFESITSSLTNTSDNIKKTIEKISEDVSFVIEKLEEVREVTPVVAGIIRDTKDAFYSKNSIQTDPKLVSSIQYLPEVE